MSSLKAPNQVGTSTVTNNVPPYVSQAQQYYLGNAENITAPFLNPPPYMVAGFTPDQEQAFGIARNLNPNVGGNVGDYGSPTASYEGVNWQSNAPAAQLTPDAIRAMFNPYQKDVVDTTTQQLQEANDKQLSAIRARQASEGAYGGNRGALQESEQNRNFGNTLASTVAGLNFGGYNTAANLGMGNTQLQQQTTLANQDAYNRAQALASQMWQQNAQFNAQQALNASAMENNLKNADWQRQLQQIQTLLGTGGEQQTLAQKALNVPYTALGALQGTIPQNYGSSTSTPIYGPTTASTLGSVAALGAGALGAFSDETMKKDKDKLGKHPATGLNIYSYRWKGQPSDAPKSIGPMAQEVEQKYPGSTMRVGGKMMIKGGARAMLGMM